MAAVVAATESAVDAANADAPAHHHIAPEFFDHIVAGPGFVPVDVGGDSDDDHPELPPGRRWRTWLSTSSCLRTAVGLSPQAADCSCGRDSGGSHDDSTRTRSWIRHRSGDARRLPRQPLPLGPSISPSLLPDDVSPLEPAFPAEPLPTHPLLDGAIIPYVTLQLPAGYVNPVRPVTPVNARHFLAIIEDVRRAISLGVNPTRIAKGSSGSYFCRNNAVDKVAAPHLPALLSAALASSQTRDTSSRPEHPTLTEVVALASPTFFYKRRDRRRFARGVPLPPKLGSFQLFLSDFKDATTFLRDGYEQLVQHQARAPSPAVSVASPTDRPNDENNTFGRSSPAFSVSSR
ncbi:phosphatidyl inositol kinase, partial [Cladochytrium tenue]